LRPKLTRGEERYTNNRKRKRKIIRGERTVKGLGKKNLR